MVVTVEHDSGAGDVAADVKDNGDGTYHVVYRATKPGNYTVRVTIDGKNVKNTPASVTILDGNNLDGLCSDIQKLHKVLELPDRNFSSEELSAPNATEALEEERNG